MGVQVLKNDRLGEPWSGTPTPAQWTCCRRCRDAYTIVPIGKTCATRDCTLFCTSATAASRPALLGAVRAADAPPPVLSILERNSMYSHVLRHTFETERSLVMAHIVMAYVVMAHIEIWGLLLRRKKEVLWCETGGRENWWPPPANASSHQFSSHQFFCVTMQPRFLFMA